MSSSHPLLSAVLPMCEKYPNQAPALFQTFTDLTLAQSWQDLTTIDMAQYDQHESKHDDLSDAMTSSSSCPCALIAGRPRSDSPFSYVLPMTLAQPTSMAQFTSLFSALDRRHRLLSQMEGGAQNTNQAPGKSEEATMVYLAIVEKDGSTVYYVLRRGIVSPKEAPE